jgi:hypothetical protein
MKSFLRSSSLRAAKLVAPVLCLSFCFAAHTAQAQSLNYEGSTGIYVTPLAYTAASPAKGLGKPSIAYHFLALGSTVGDYSTFSVTEGFAKRYEVGYTSAMHSGKSFVGSDGDILDSDATSHDFSIIHGKATIISENSFKMKWVPAISVGGVFRFNDHNLFNGGHWYGTAGTQNTRNGDIYLVGSKTITQISKHVPVLFSAGLRGTDASLWGLAGNAPNMTVRGFGSLALVFHGPAKSTVIVGSEVSQQPQQVKVGTVAVPASAVDIPTSETYAIRVFPSPKYKLNIDAAVLHASTSGSLPIAAPRGLNVNDRVVFGVSYGF